MLRCIGQEAEERSTGLRSAFDLAARAARRLRHVVDVLSRAGSGCSRPRDRTFELAKLSVKRFDAGDEVIDRRQWVFLSDASACSTGAVSAVAFTFTAKSMFSFTDSSPIFGQALSRYGLFLVARLREPRLREIHASRTTALRDRP